MSRKHDRLYDLQFAFEQYKKSGHGDWLADIIRVGGATNIPWPEGMAEAVADLINFGNPWTARDQTRVDDTWIYYVYWRETEYRNGKHHASFSKFAIREVEKWFEARGTPKSYETIRSRLRYNYAYWRDSLSSDDIETMRAAAGVVEKNKTTIFTHSVRNLKPMACNQTQRRSACLNHVSFA